MIYPLTTLEHYTVAYDEAHDARVALAKAQERQTRAQLAMQDAWRLVRWDPNVPLGVHALRGGRAVRISMGDYPDVETLFRYPLR